MKPIQAYLLPALVAMSVGLYMVAINAGVDVELAVLISSVISLAAAAYFERLIPYRSEWNRGVGDTRTDLLSAALLIGVADPITKVAVPILAGVLYAQFSVQGVLAGTNLLVQVLVVLLVVEFGKYWSHRLHHKYGPLWWLHAMHHSSERLYVVNGLRFHPINYFINSCMGLVPALLLGASPEAVIGYLAVVQPIVLVQHANLDLKMGWLNSVISTPEAHRWHHSTVPEEAKRNFGNAILIWDHVFRTYQPASGFDKSRSIGLFAESGAVYPGKASYFKQLASMLRAPCCVA